MKSPKEEHRFDDKEFARILNRAVELDGRPEAVDETKFPPPSRSDGLTFDEVLEIAGEVGVEPARVVQAVDSLSVEGWSALARAFGGPVRVRGRRTLLRKLAPNEMGRLLDIVRETLGMEGESHEVLGGVEWKGKTSQESVSVRLVPQEGKTVIYLNADRGLSAFLSHYLPILASLGVAGVSIGVLEPLSGGAMTGIILGCAATGYGVGRILWASGTRRWRRLLDTVADRMVKEGGDG